MKSSDRAAEAPQHGLARYAWLPIPLLLAAIIAARTAGWSRSYEADTLRLILSFIFYTLASLGTLYLIGRSFLASGMPGLLLLECGVILWTLSGTVGDAVSQGNANINVTIFNTGILLAGACHLTGAVLSPRSQRALRVPALWLTGASALTLIALWLVTQATLADWLPVFFITGQGGTPVRYWVLTSAIAMFVLSAGLLLPGRRRTHPSFATWYAMALLLLAVGLFGVMIQLSLGSVVNWLGRTAQWLGGLYLLAAAAAALRGSAMALLPPARGSRPILYRDAVAAAVVVAAAAVRLAFLPALGTGAPFVTFYPAVMLAALYGGLRSGLLATVLSAILAGYFWIGPMGQFTMGQPSDWLALAVFVASGAMISGTTGAMQGARARAAEAQRQAMLSAERAAAAEELRESEARYQSLVNLSPDAIIVSHNGRFLFANPAAARLYGAPSPEALMGHSVMDRLHPDFHGMLQERRQHIVESGRAAPPVEMVVLRLDGTPVSVEVSISAVEYEGCPAVQTVLRDVTERKRAEEALRLARDTLEERVRERTADLERRTVQLRSLALELSQAENRERKRLATVLHDHLQQILVGAKLGIQLAQKEAVGDSLRESIRSVADLLDESIKVSRSLTVELSPPILHEAGLVAAIRWLARWMGEKHGISVEVTADTDVPPDAEGVSALLFQSVRELLFNVVKHAGAAAAHVSISADDGKLRIVVADKGAGFDVAGAYARGSEGGFGLFSIRERIDLLGGRMDIDSAPGMGTRVTLVAPLPRRAASVRMDAIAETTAQLSPVSACAAEPGNARRIRVLVADDHTIMREGLTKLVRGQADIDVVGEASDGRAAVEMAHQLRPDVIIMDVSMPGMNGIEATKRIRAELPDIQHHRPFHVREGRPRGGDAQGGRRRLPHEGRPVGRPHRRHSRNVCLEAVDSAPPGRRMSTDASANPLSDSARAHSAAPAHSPGTTGLDWRSQLATC